jgi:hypothetical protein
MKKYILILSLLIVSLFSMEGQTDARFSTVPVVNGKVVFEQFILADQGQTADQKYALLQKWGKNTFTGNPLLSGIRFDDKARTVTVSSKAELKLPANKAGVSEKIMMNYRFDASVTHAGCMLVVRDITYQTEQTGGSSFFPKVYTAEQMITDQAVSAASEESELRNNTRKETITFLNNLYAQLAVLF